jgi:hypothetical protein
LFNFFNVFVGQETIIMHKKMLDLLNSSELLPPLQASESEQLADAVLKDLAQMSVYPRSISSASKSVFFLGRRNEHKNLGIVSRSADIPARFEGQTQTTSIGENEVHFLVGPLSANNASHLRETLPFLRAKTLGLNKSAGCGDRLGLATPGHIHAISKTRIAPIFAQQSVRENERTGRSPQQVMDDAMWGVFQEGWRGGFGADADHLKTTHDIDAFAAAGYTFFTIDPGEFVDAGADSAPLAKINAKVETLPWDLLESTPADMRRALVDKTIELGDIGLRLDKDKVLGAAAKYGNVVAHTVRMYRHLVDVMHHQPFEFEISVDETDTVTTLAEHVYIAAELKRLGVTWVSLAPRYIGRFEKGVDYIGDLDKFEESFDQHAAVSRHYGPYKLSLHSGSDKFSVYPIAARLAGDLIHLKTAGTSYLEALRTIAVYDPVLFRKIMNFAIERYPEDRASYHVSAEISAVSEIKTWPDDGLGDLLDDFHAREILHVTYGSVLNDSRLQPPFFQTLIENEDAYTEFVEKHFDRHFRPFEAGTDDG